MGEGRRSQASMRPKAAVGVCKELEMNTLLRFGAPRGSGGCAVRCAAIAGRHPVVQPHSTIADTANADPLVTTVARRGRRLQG